MRKVGIECLELRIEENVSGIVHAFAILNSPLPTLATTTAGSF